MEMVKRGYSMDGGAGSGTTDGHERTQRTRRERVIRMSRIMEGDCDMVKGQRLYVALKKAIEDGRTIALKFDPGQPISISTRIMNPSFGGIMDRYGKDVFQGRLKLSDVPKGVKDLIVDYIEKYRKS